MTYTLIERYEVAAATEASVVFDNIPDIYSDLVVKISCRSARTEVVDYIYMSINSASSMSSRFLYKDGTTVAQASRSTNEIAYVNGDTTSASAFSITDVFIGDYLGSHNKQIYTTSTGTNHGSTSQLQSIYSTTSSVTDPISSLTFTLLNSDYKQYSTFSLYGLASGSDGIVTVS